MHQSLLIHFDQLDIVRNNSLFSGLTEAEKDGFLKDGFLYKYPRKSFLFREMDPVHFVYMMCRGLVHEFRNTLGGSEMTVNIHKTESFFCTTSLFLQDTFYNTNARALEDTYVLELPIEKFKKDLKKYDLVAERLISSAALF